MRVYCTYCSSKKDTSQKELSAIERYKSKRIEYILEKALNSKIEFLILSGKYGLLKTRSIIPYYDHLLTNDQVTDHSSKVAKQLALLKVKELVFFSDPICKDKNIEAYINCIKESCKKAKIDLKIVYI